MHRAYEAVRRYARDPVWGRVTGNPEARPHLASARVQLRMARDYLRHRAEESAAPPPRHKLSAFAALVEHPIPAASAEIRRALGPGRRVIALTTFRGRARVAGEVTMVTPGPDGEALVYVRGRQLRGSFPIHRFAYAQTEA